jgi:tripartite motif-containing protein 71
VGGDSEDVVAPMREKIAVAPPPGATAADTEPEEPPAFLEQPSLDEAPFGRMKEPRGAAVDIGGRIWIADFGNSRLRVFDSSGRYVGGWGGRGNGTFGLREPCAVAIRGADVYIADTWNGRIQHFTLAGEWKQTATGLYGPRGVAAAPDGSVWVADTGNNRITHYDSALESLGAFGKKGSGPDEFSGPVGIAVGATGTVYVADTGNRRIQILDSSGHRLREIRFPGWQVTAVEPHIAVGADESLFVTDPGQNKLIELDRNGSLRREWNAGSDGKALARPTGVAIDRKNAILYVVNSGSNSVSQIRLSERKTP